MGPNNNSFESARETVSEDENNEVWPHAASTWTPINKIPFRERSPPSALANEAKDTGDLEISAVNEEASDEEILSNTRLLEGTNLVRLAGKMTNKEIVAAVNSRHNKPVLTDMALSIRMTRCLTKVAEQQGRSRESVKAELKANRKVNVAASAAVKQAKKSELVAESLPPSAASEDDEETEPDETDDNEDLEKLRENCEKILKEDRSQIKNGRLFKVAQVFCNAEIVARVPQLTHSRVSERLYKAITWVAKRDDRPREVVKAEFDQTRTVNGVFARQIAHSKATRAASRTTKQNKIRDEDAMDIDDAEPVLRSQVEDSEDEDPLGDLEEMSRRDLLGSLFGRSIDDSSGEFAKPIPRPFDTRFVGYMAHDPKLFIPGFRAYNPDGTQILR